jgi:hypothetical protein
MSGFVNYLAANVLINVYTYFIWYQSHISK